MSGSEPRARARESLEAKKRKLADLRRRKEERAKRSAEISSDVRSKISQPAAPNVDDLVKSLLDEPGEATTSKVASDAPATTPAPAPATAPENGIQDVGAPSARRETAPLSLRHGVGILSLKSKLPVAYDREVQTTEVGAGDDGEDADSEGPGNDDGVEDTEEPTPSPAARRFLDVRARGPTLQRPDPAPLPVSLPHPAHATQGEAPSATAEAEPAAAPAREPMSAGDFAALCKDDGFRAFLRRAGSIADRAAREVASGRAVVDYEADGEAVTSSVGLSPLHALQPPRRTDELVVSSVALSPWHPDLVAVALAPAVGGAAGAVGGQGGMEGTVVLWTLAAPERPEYEFQCEAPVLCVAFHPHNPRVVLGGTATGEIALWRLGDGPHPSQRTPLRLESHVMPICSMTVIGTSTAHSLLSVSTDGRVCTWSTEQLATFYGDDTFELQPRDLDQQSTVVCASHASTDPRLLFLGCEDGSLHCAALHDTERTLVSTARRAHLGGIVALHCHPRVHDSIDADASEAMAVSALVLTASSDQTLKLWAGKHLGQPLLSFSGANETYNDVKWCPSHASVFAACDGRGFAEVWNPCASTERPLLRHRVCEHAISRVEWSADSATLVIGDAVGCTHVLNVSDVLLQDPVAAVGRLAALVRAERSRQQE